MTVFSRLLDVLADVSDPRRAQGKLYTLPHVLLFAILAIVTGRNTCPGIVPVIDVHRRKLNTAFDLTWCQAPAHTAVRAILQELDLAGGSGFPPPRRPAACGVRHVLAGTASCWMARCCLAASKVHDRAAAQVLSAFATDTALALAHVDIAEKSNELPALHTILNLSAI